MDFNMDFGNMQKSVYGGNFEEDEELLAELAAIQEEELGAEKKTKKNVSRPAKPGNIDQKQLAAALSDDNHQLNDEELENDQDLLSELAGLVGGSSPTPPSQSLSPPPALTSTFPAAVAASPCMDEGKVAHLRKLHTAYSKLHNNAEKNGEGAKARRYKRAVEKLVELIRSVEKGKQIDEAEIPQEPPNFASLCGPSPSPQYVAPAHPTHHSTGPSIREAAAVSTPPPVPERRTAPPLPVRQASSSKEPSDPKKAAIYKTLKHRKELYVANGKAAIAAKDKVAAKEFVDMVKAFEQALTGLDQVSADEMDLSDVPPSPPPYRKKEEASSSHPPAQSAPIAAQPQAKIAAKPSTFLEALEQRHKRYREIAEKAKTDGNDRKARMNTRIAGQYADAIKLAKAGKAVDVAELAALPDMSPLPPQGTGSTLKKRATPVVGPLAASGQEGKSRNSVQLEFLRQRQNQFKQAALHAKTRGHIDMAKKYIAEAMGFEKMIRAAEAGLPVDIKNTPIPPQSNTSIATLEPRIKAETSSSTSLEGRGERLELLEKTLIEQIRAAETNQMRFTRLGDVGKVALFEGWGKSSKQDLLLVRAVAQQGLNLPKFHYEIRHIPSADLFPDLAEDVLELTIISCRDVPLPSGYEPHHANIFVRYTFPLPSDNPQMGKTKTVASTSPEFNETIMLQIGSGKLRNSKLQRAFKRGGLKFEVYQKGGFMRSDKLLGTCEWKLDQLEQTAELQESLPLKEGRKAVGGLATARIRIREPIGDAKAKSQAQKWLILDN